MTEPAHLFLYFKCGCLRRLLNGERAAYWLEQARLALCPECLDKKDVPPDVRPKTELANAHR